jgi:multiple sugar transport system substrate-binding protein
VDLKLPTDLKKGLQMEADAVAKQAQSKDAKVVPLPVGLGGKGGEFNKAITDTFVRIVVRNEPVQTVLTDQAAIIQKVMNDVGVKCWGPDAPSAGPCQVK